MPYEEIKQTDKIVFDNLKEIESNLNVMSDNQQQIIDELKDRLIILMKKNFQLEKRISRIEEFLIKEMVRK